MNLSPSDVIRSIYESFNREDLDGILAVLSPELELVDYGVGVTYTGREGFLAWLEPWEKAAPDGKAYLDSLVAEGSTVATEHTHRGTQTGDFVLPCQVVPASNRPMEVHFAEFFLVREELIVSWRNYWDVGQMIDQLT